MKISKITIRISELIVYVCVGKFGKELINNYECIPFR